MDKTENVPAVKATPYARKIAKQYHIDLEAIPPSGLHGEILSRDVEMAHEGRQMTREVPVTPLAERIARMRHIDLSSVKGTGIGGKISKRDVLEATGSIEPELEPGELRIPLTGMRRTIAERMTEASKVPTSTLTTKVDVTALLEARKRHNGRGGSHYTVSDLVMYAAVRALSDNKKMLCSFDHDSIIFKNDINLGIAVALDDGLIVPVLRNADLLSLEELSLQAHELERRARNRTLLPDECRGNTFTVTNIGMFGVEAFTPLINLPDAAILGICAISDGVIAQEGRAVVRKVMRICLTFDHRLMDGTQGAKFNLNIRAILENPGSWIDTPSGDGKGEKQ